MSEPQVIEVTPHECWIASRAERGETSFAVTHPYDGTEIATVWAPDTEQVDRAVTAACAHHEPDPAVRATALDALANAMAARAQECAELLTAERGTPITAAGAEVERSLVALRSAAWETGRYPATNSTAVPAWVRRRPRGPLLATTGSARPLESATRAVATAVAAGTPVLLLPPTTTPLSALLLGELLAEVDLSDGAFSVLPLDASTAGDRNVSLVHGKFEAVTETTVVLCPDWSSGHDLAYAAQGVATRCEHTTALPGGVTNRVLVAETCFRPLVEQLRATFGSVAVGSPHDPSVAVGSLPDEASTELVADRIDAALDAGYEMVAGGDGDGASLAPTVLAAPAPGRDPWHRDIPGPVLLVSAVPDLDAAMTAANALGAERNVALLTHGVGNARVAAERLHAGTITVGAFGRSTWDARAAVRDLTRVTTTEFPAG